MELVLNGRRVHEPFSLYLPDKTFADLLEFANEDVSCEVLDGVLVIKSPASFIHESIFGFLFTVLKLYIRKHQLGITLGSRFTLKLVDNWGLEPDIMFLTPKDQERLRETYLDGPATTVFEILSKSNRKEDVEKKIPQYLQYGVQEVGLIDPTAKALKILWPGGCVSEGEKGWVISRAIPGFRIKTAWLWEPQVKSEIDAVREMEE